MLKRFGALSLVVLMGAVAIPPSEAPVADAAEHGDLETVRTLVRQGADVNASQGDGMTALHWAAERGSPELAQMLLYAGADPEPATRLGGYTPLHLASHRGHTEVVGVLAAGGSDVGALTTTGVSALHLAAESGSGATAGALLQAGAEVDVRDGHSGRTPLMFAAAHGNLAVVDVLLKAGADVTQASDVVDYVERGEEDAKQRKRRARLVEAAKEPKEEVEDTASTEPETATATPEPETEPEPAPATDPDRKAEPRDPRAIPGNDSAQVTVSPLSYTQLVGAQGGFNALHYAARDGNLETARLLLDAGADVNQVTGGDQSSPLLVSVINGNYDLAMLLLERGADASLVSEDGAGPLFAVLNGRWALRTWYPQPSAWQQQDTDYLGMMRALLEAGAEPNARVNTHIWYTAYNAGRMGVDFAGATPFWRAAYSLDVEAMKLLVEFGADPNIPTTKPAQRRFPGFMPDEDEEEEEDPSGLAPVEPGGPAVHPLHAASGVGYGTSRVGQQHVTVPNGWRAAVRYLVDDLGVDVNVRDHDGYSALHNAAARGDDEMLRYLIDKGADVMFVSRRGQTTVDMANGPQQRVQPFPTTMALLMEHGAINNDNCQSCE